MEPTLRLGRCGSEMALGAAGARFISAEGAGKRIERGSAYAARERIVLQIEQTLGWQEPDSDTDSTSVSGAQPIGRQGEQA